MAVQSINQIRDFDEWVKICIETSLPTITDEKLIQVLANIGIDDVSLINEKDSLKIRLYISELIMKRKQCKIEGLKEYLAIINRLLCYAEYLDCSGKSFLKNKNKSDDDKSGKSEIDENVISELNQRDKSTDSLIVSYCLSRLNMNAVKALGYKTFNDAFRGLGAILEQKASTIKNMRDEFDPYFDNGRVGWYQRELRASRKKVYDLMENVSDEELLMLLKEIIDFYSENQQCEQEIGTRKRIKISTGEMKVIKSRKK